MGVWEIVLASGVVGLLFSFAQQLALWKLNRRAAKEDRADSRLLARLAAVEAGQQKLSAGMLAMLRDRIKHLGLKYLAAGGLSLDDRDNLLALHGAYRANGGNGNLDQLIADIKALPLDR